jgi:hypothetical protein
MTIMAMVVFPTPPLPANAIVVVIQNLQICFSLVTMLCVVTKGIALRAETYGPKSGAERQGDGCGAERRNKKKNLLNH